MFCKLDVRRKSIVTLALSSDCRKIFFCKSGPVLRTFGWNSFILSRTVESSLKPVQFSYARACIISMMHGSESDIEIWWTRGWNVTRERRTCATFSTEDHRISMSHERPCFICFVVWSTYSLKLYIVFWDDGETWVRLPSKNAHTPNHCSWLAN